MPPLHRMIVTLLTVGRLRMQRPAVGFLENAIQRPPKWFSLDRREMPRRSTESGSDPTTFGSASLVFNLLHFPIHQATSPDEKPSSD